MTRILLSVAMLALAPLAACEGADQGPGGLTAEESDALNEAAEMLDTSPDSLIAEDAAELGNGEVTQVLEDDVPVTDSARQ